MGFITPKIQLTPDGRTAAYWAKMPGAYEEGLFKSTGGQSELVSVGPKGNARGVLCPGEHYDCDLLMSPDGERIVFETATSLVNEDADSCPIGNCVDVYERIGNITRLLSTLDPAGEAGPLMLLSTSCLLMATASSSIFASHMG